MTKPTRAHVWCVVLCLASSSWALAQGTTGSIAGTLTDSSGAVLPGVTVTLSGPNVQGARTATTDERGFYRFRNLPPGSDYKVAATLSGFRAASQEAIHVFLGQEGTINIVLAPASVTEVVQVAAASPLVDVKQTTTGVNITSRQFETLPTARNFQQLTTIAPSVTLEMGDHDRRFETSPTVGASSAPENNYIIDGLSVTDPRYGTSGANLTMNFVQEVQVLTGGYQAEFGRSTGGVFNVVTKSGGNSFHGDLFNYYRNKDWTPDDVVRRRNKELVTTANRTTSYDFGGSLGGPIVRDKVWFFGAIDPTRATTHLGGVVDEGQAVSPISSREYDRDSNIYAAKVSFTMSSNHTVVASAFGDPTEREGWLGIANSDPTAALRLEKTGSHNFNTKYSGILKPTWLLDVNYGRHNERVNLEAATSEGRTIPRQIDETLGQYEHGGFPRVQNDRAHRDAFAVKFTNALAAHEFRYGFDMERNNYKADLNETWYRFFGATSDAASYIQERNYSVVGEGTTTNLAWFAQDAWRVATNLQLNLGVRYENQWLDSANDVAVGGRSDAEDCVVHLECRTVDKLKLTGNWAPRLGISWDPANNGRSKIYGFWGRFYEAIPLDMNIRAINGERYIISLYGSQVPLTSTNFYNTGGSPLARNGPWFLRRSPSTLVNITPLDEDLKSQYEDQFIVGGEYQFANVWSAGVRFVNRELRRIIEDIGTFTDPDDPIALTGYVIGNPGEGFFGAPFDKPKRTYNALEFTVQRAYADNWHMTSSFVWASAKGNHEGLYMSGYDQLDPNITALYDIPSFLPNSDGRLRADKPYQFKLFAGYTTNWGLTVSEGFFLSAGVPISAQGPEIVNGYGDGTIFLQPRGEEGRTGAFWNFDVHADYKIPVFGPGSTRGLSIIVDVFNLFNRHETLEVDQDYIYEGDPNIELWEADSNLDAYGNPKFNPNLPSSKYFSTPILFQTPRSVQIGLKLTF
jgi:outer membrane receptor protein involved in Fe transport